MIRSLQDDVGTQKKEKLQGQVCSQLLIRFVHACAYMHVAACGAGQSGNACNNLASYPRKIYFQLSTPKMDMHGTPPGVLPTRSYSVLTWFRNG
jgi:hypothetical protein